MSLTQATGRVRRRTGSRLVRTAAAALAAGVLTAPLPAGASGAEPTAAAGARAPLPVTPGDFTGFGFDQCLAPTQQSMDAWLRTSPYWAVGIYISGDSRACRNQPNLTPTWVRTQLRKGWRLLPITLGPQASCNPRFPRYDDDVRINPRRADNYRAARVMGREEAAAAVAAATKLGIPKGSTLWYDMEAYDISRRDCRESALAFTSAWTRKLHALGWVSGVYSSAASGIKAMDDVRVDRPDAWTLPDRIWIADWDGKANTSSTYVRDDGWLPGGRMKQYRGGHDETHGGVTINIDTNFLDLGAGSVAGPPPVHCDRVRLGYRSYPTLRTGDNGRFVRALQCGLAEQGYPAVVTGVFDDATAAAVDAFRADRGWPSAAAVRARLWTALFAAGDRPLLKYGAAGEDVRRLQRALNAAIGADLRPVGVFEATTTEAVRRYQRAVDTAATGVVTGPLWRALQDGRR